MALSSSWTSHSPPTKVRSKGMQRAATIVLVGSPDGGKGNVLHAYTDGSYPATERPNHMRLVHNTAAIKVCDTPGDVEFAVGHNRKKRRMTSSGPVGLVAVYNVEDRASLEAAVQTLKGHIRIGSCLNGMALAGIWDGDRPRRRTVTHKQGKDAALEIGASFVEVGCNNEGRGIIRTMVRSFAETCRKDWEQKLQTEKEKNGKKQKSPYSFIKTVLRFLKRTKLCEKNICA